MSLEGTSGLTAVALFQKNIRLGSVSVSLSAGGAHIVGFRRTSTTAGEIRIDGVATAFAISSNPDFETDSVPEVGYHFTRESTTSLDGDLAEVIIARDPSDKDVATVESYLKAKYGL